MSWRFGIQTEKFYASISLESTYLESPIKGVLELVNNENEASVLISVRLVELSNPSNLILLMVDRRNINFYPLSILSLGLYLFLRTTISEKMVFFFIHTFKKV